MTKPRIVVDDHRGIHNSRDFTSRLKKEGNYRNRSTVCIIPTRGMISARVVQNWMGMMIPMNQKFIRLFMIGMEVGAAYEAAIDFILKDKELSTWKYIFTLEEDNMVPPDVLLKLYESIDQGYDAVGGLYWTKGEEGQPMCYGDPSVVPLNFIPQIPMPETVTRCNGLGMGATLFKMKMFKDQEMERPFFKTVQSYDPQKGGAAFTQDLWFFMNACKFGYKFACDSRVKVGHFDFENDIVW